MYKMPPEIILAEESVLNDKSKILESINKRFSNIKHTLESVLTACECISDKKTYNKGFQEIKVSKKIHNIHAYKSWQIQLTSLVNEFRLKMTINDIVSLKNSHETGDNKVNNKKNTIKKLYAYGRKIDGKELGITSEDIKRCTSKIFENSVQTTPNNECVRQIKKQDAKGKPFIILPVLEAYQLLINSMCSPFSALSIIGANLDLETCESSCVEIFGCILIIAEDITAGYNILDACHDSTIIDNGDGTFDVSREIIIASSDAIIKQFTYPCASFENNDIDASTAFLTINSKVKTIRSKNSSIYLLKTRSPFSALDASTAIRYINNNYFKYATFESWELEKEKYKEKNGLIKTNKIANQLNGAYEKRRYEAIAKFNDLGIETPKHLLWPDKRYLHKRQLSIFDIDKKENLGTAIDRFDKDNFITDKHNISAWKYIMQWPKWKHNILVLTGCKGSGKTHLAKIWGECDNGQFIENLFHSSFIKTLFCDELSSQWRYITKNIKKFVIEDIDEYLNYAPEHLIDAFFALLTKASDDSCNYYLFTAKTLNINTMNDIVTRLASYNLAHIVSDVSDQFIDVLIIKYCSDYQLNINNSQISYIKNNIQRTPCAIKIFFQRLNDFLNAEGKKINFDILKRCLYKMPN